METFHSRCVSHVDDWASFVSDPLTNIGLSLVDFKFDPQDARSGTVLHKVQSDDSDMLQLINSRTCRVDTIGPGGDLEHVGSGGHSCAGYTNLVCASSETLCQHGRCLEDPSAPSGYKCICSTGFGGVNCDKCAAILVDHGRPLIGPRYSCAGNMGDQCEFSSKLPCEDGYEAIGTNVPLRCKYTGWVSSLTGTRADPIQCVPGSRGLCLSVCSEQQPDDISAGALKQGRFCEDLALGKFRCLIPSAPSILLQSTNRTVDGVPVLQCVEPQSDLCGQAAATGIPVALNREALRYECPPSGSGLWFRFKAQVGATYTFRVRLQTLTDSVMSLIDTDGETRLVQNDDSDRADSFVEWTCAVDGTYFLLVQGMFGESGTFDLTGSRRVAIESCSSDGGARVVLAANRTYDLRRSMYASTCDFWVVDCGCGRPAIEFTTMGNNILSIYFSEYGDGDADVVVDGRNGCHDEPPVCAWTGVEHSAPDGTSKMAIKDEHQSDVDFVANIRCSGQPVLTDSCVSCTLGKYFRVQHQKPTCDFCPVGAICPGGTAGHVFCPAGQQPDNEQRCVQCPAGKFSPGEGICTLCPEANQEPNENQTACSCQNGFYDWHAHGFVNCRAGNFRPVRPDITSPACISCHNMHCIEQCGKSVIIRSGFALAIENQNHLTDTIVNDVYQCPNDQFSHGTAVVCQSTTVSIGARCARGFTGPLCQACTSDYAKHNQECRLCHTSNAVVGIEIWMFVTVLLLMATAYYVYVVRHARTMRQNPSRLSEQLQTFHNPVGPSEPGQSVPGSKPSEHTGRQQIWLLLQTITQPVRILIGFAQVVAQLGRVLHVQYPPLMTSVFNLIEPLLADVWGTIVHLDCVGIRGAYAGFILHALALPLFFVVAILVKYGWQCRSDRVGALRQLPSNMFAAIFLCYPTVRVGTIMQLLIDSCFTSFDNVLCRLPATRSAITRLAYLTADSCHRRWWC
eukprot:SAG22_NODE_510_length_9598_cov_6.080114_5_plen_965_part_00